MVCELKQRAAVVLIGSVALCKSLSLSKSHLENYNQVYCPDYCKGLYEGQVGQQS